jgi:uncharacterized membrane protein YeaQ/YmgE (transglycosylase-associated protein family)
MSIIAWIVVGLVAGALARLVVPGDHPGGIWPALAIGVVGAIIGGWIWNLFGAAGATGIDIGSIFVAFIGSVILLALYQMTTGRSRAT